MRTFNRTIILVIGAGAVLALTGLAQAESRHMRSRRVFNRGFISQPPTFRRHDRGPNARRAANPLDTRVRERTTIRRPCHIRQSRLQRHAAKLSRPRDGASMAGDFPHGIIVAITDTAVRAGGATADRITEAPGGVSRRL